MPETRILSHVDGESIAPLSEGGTDGQTTEFMGMPKKKSVRWFLEHRREIGDG